MKRINYRRSGERIIVEYGGQVVGSYCWSSLPVSVDSDKRMIEYTNHATGERKLFNNTKDLADLYLNKLYPYVRNVEIEQGGHISFKYNDGGRSKYYKAERVGDCFTRAFAIASGVDYKVIYDMVNEEEKRGKKYKGSARSGVYTRVARKIAEKLGGRWHTCMTIGSGCHTHLRQNELPKGKIVCNLSRHFCAVIDGVLNDTYDCSRGGERCVYGYWVF